MRSKKCEAATSESNPGNANLPIGDGTEAQNANREIGVPRVSQPTSELKFKLGHYGIKTGLTVVTPRVKAKTAAIL
jgi:hypothetical protein